MEIASGVEIKSTSELIDWAARVYPNDPAVYTGIPEPDNRIKMRSLSYIDLLRAVDRLTWHYVSVGVKLSSPSSTIPPLQIVAVLVPPSIDMILLEFALCKLGQTSLLLSPTNSVVASAHLVKETKASHLLYNCSFAEDAKAVERSLNAENYEITLVEEKRFPLWGNDGIANANDVKSFKPLLNPDQEAERPAVILHSSGSTGLPKPIYYQHYNLTVRVSHGRLDSGFTILPLYHAYGHFSVIRSLRIGAPVTIYPPHLPLTAGNICSVYAASPVSRYCFTVPYVLKLLGETDEGMRLLTSFVSIPVSGAPTPDDLGDRLTAAGARIMSMYGSSEMGIVMTSMRDFPTDKGWNWLRPLHHTKDFMFFEPRGEDMFELVMREYPERFAYNVPKDLYATKDVFQRHPEHPNQFRYIGRLDDTLVHVSGKKTNPVTMELVIRGDPHVSEAIVFGANRPQTGVLILPSERGKDMSKDELIKKIWPVIEVANKDAPSYSRIAPEMVEILPFGTHIPFTPKLSFVRPACYAKFKDIIDNVYARFEVEPSDIEKISLTSLEEMERYLIQIIEKAVAKKESPRKDEDLFSFGVDSLQATRIRNTIQRELELGEGVTLRNTVVFEHPTVEKLANHLFALTASDGVSACRSDQDKILGMLEKHFVNIQPRTAVTINGHPEPRDYRVVLLTGATGSLGAHVLHNLLASTSVQRVICISRATTHAESRERVKESLRLRKIPVPEEPRWTAYAGNPNLDALGLSGQEYEQVRAEVTDVIHNAWPVNFLLKIDSFDEHIAGAVNLMNLCQQSAYAEPARFYYSSSISSRGGQPPDVDILVKEDFPPDSPSVALDMGYGQSKWIVEKLCQRAAAEKGLVSSVFRIGQLVGDTVHGIWNETETPPHIIKSANVNGVLPVSDRIIQWLPVDYAAQGIAEIVLSPPVPQEVTTAVYHIVNANTITSWNDILSGLESAELKFKRVSLIEWLEKQAISEQDPVKNPIVKLLDLFRARFNVVTADRAKSAGILFDTVETSKVSTSIRNSPPLTSELVVNWVKHWRQTGFLV